jgi:hypothetical protein
MLEKNAKDSDWILEPATGVVNSDKGKRTRTNYNEQ